MKNNDLQEPHPHSGSSSTWFLVKLEFGNVGFWGEGKTGVPGEKPLGARETTNNILNPHMASTSGFEPGPHSWEASALTTAPPLLPKEQGWRVSSLKLPSTNAGRDPELLLIPFSFTTETSLRALLTVLTACSTVALFSQFPPKIALWSH